MPDQGPPAIDTRAAWDEQHEVGEGGRGRGGGRGGGGGMEARGKRTATTCGDAETQKRPPRRPRRAAYVLQTRAAGGLAIDVWRSSARSSATTPPAGDDKGDDEGWATSVLSLDADDRTSSRPRR